MSRPGMAGFAGMLLAAGTLGSGCSATSGARAERVVFTVATGFSQGGPATTIDVIDVGLPDLHNLSSHAVKLRSVTLVAAPAGFHIRSVTAYTYLPADGDVGIITGNLIQRCRQNIPHPLTEELGTPKARVKG